VPEDADSPRFRTNIGSVHYAPEQSAIIWKIKQFGGGKEFLMRAELGLPSVKGDDEHGGGMTGGYGGSMGGAGQTAKGKRPINVKFEIPYFTTSGIQVRYLKIIEPKVSQSPISYLVVLHAASSISMSLLVCAETAPRCELLHGSPVSYCFLTLTHTPSSTEGLCFPTLGERRPMGNGDVTTCQRPQASFARSRCISAAFLMTASQACFFLTPMLITILPPRRSLRIG
jgi:hypothetical protein